ncbi:hypothetical protein [Pyrodictium delaneyi]|nr:hypothetical protein [Pyrodictium delaneyi]
MQGDWLLPVVYLTCTRAGLDRTSLARLLGVPGSTAKKLVWAAARRGLVRVEEGYIRATTRGLELIEKVEYVARRANKLVFLVQGRLLMVVVRPRRGLRAYSIPSSLACKVYSVVASGVDSPREVAARTGTHPKTASIVMRALQVLDCPGADCVLAELCGPGGKE